MDKQRKIELVADYLREWSGGAIDGIRAATVPCFSEVEPPTIDETEPSLCLGDGDFVLTFIGGKEITINVSKCSTWFPTGGKP